MLVSIFSYVFSYFFFLRKKKKRKKNYKLTVADTLACSAPSPWPAVPPPLSGIQGEFGKNALQAGKRGCDSRPGVSSLFPWLKLGCRSRVSCFLTYAGLWRRQRSEKPERRRTVSLPLGNFKCKRHRTKEGIVAQAIAKIYQGLGFSTPRAGTDLILA